MDSLVIGRNWELFQIVIPFPHSWLWIERLVAGPLDCWLLTQPPFIGPGI